MIERSRHLHDDALVEYYFADRRGEPLDPPSAEHLADCDACCARYSEFVTLLDQARGDAEAEADAVFTPDRLHQQQEQIARRLEQAIRPARVLSFPGQSVQVHAGIGRVGPWWLAAAAAAGLFVGVVVGGTLLQPGSGRTAEAMRVGGTQQQAATRLGAAPAVRVNAPATLDSIDDDAFLMQLELELERPHTQELQPFDALTPHVREIDVSAR
jgi:hypothetical protein